MLNRLTLFAACLSLASCASTPVEFARPSPPPSLTQQCANPAALPERALSDQEIEILWGRDRTALRECASRLSGLVGWVRFVFFSEQEA